MQNLPSSLPSGGAVYCEECTQPEAGGVAPPSVIPSQVKYSASLGHSLRKMQVTDFQDSRSVGAVQLLPSALVCCRNNGVWGKKASHQTVVCPNPLASSSRVLAQGPRLRPAGWQRATSGLVQLVSKLKGQVVGSVLSLWLLLPGTPRELMEEMAD